jgi:hypothetical protein
MAQFGQLQSFAQNTRPAASADVPGAVPGVPVFNDKATEYAEHMMAEHQQGQQQQNKLQQTHALAAPAAAGPAAAGAWSSARRANYVGLPEALSHGAVIQVCVGCLFLRSPSRGLTVWVYYRVCVYYCSYSAVPISVCLLLLQSCSRGGRAQGQWRTVEDMRRETTSRGLCGLVCASRTSDRGGEGDCVKEGGGEEGHGVSGFLRFFNVKSFSCFCTRLHQTVILRCTRRHQPEVNPNSKEETSSSRVDVNRDSVWVWLGGGGGPCPWWIVSAF